MTSAGPAVGESRAHRGLVPGEAEALIAEARRRRRDRRRRAARLGLGAGLVVAAVAASIIGFSGRSARAPAGIPGWPPAGPLRPMPAQLVVWTSGFKIEVLSSGTGQVVRTLATNVALFRGLPTVAVSPAGVVYFDDTCAQAECIESTPLAGGPVTAIGQGYMPAISPDGRLLAYVAWTVKVYPPNTPVRDMAPIPEAIVVRNLATGTVRRWAFTSDVPDIGSLSWSPGDRFLSFTSLSWASGSPPDPTTQLLDTGSGGTLTGARRIPLAHGLAWAGFLTARIGMAVAPYPAAQGRQQSLVAVAVDTGRVLGRLTPLPIQGLFTANASDGTEGTITADPAGHFILIAGAGPGGDGEIFRWAAGMRQLASITSGAIRAAWA